MHSSPQVLSCQDLSLVAVGAPECTQEQGAKWPSRLCFGDPAAIMFFGVIGAESKMLART